MKNDLDRTIFVQIASYRDPQLIPTLDDLISKAELPGCLYVTVCWQHGDDETLDDFVQAGYEVCDSGWVEGVDDWSNWDDETDLDLTGKVMVNEFDDSRFPLHQLKKDNCEVELINVDYKKTKGACWARNLIQQRYGNERYTLQLDSHHRFVAHWDTLLIRMLETLRDDATPKPLITAYIPNFDPENDPDGRTQVPWKMDFQRFIPEGAIFFRPSSIDDWESRFQPMPARFYSAHFAFADGSFAEEVMHDPNYFFHGEEISIAVRAFTHGYDMFHPHRLIAWHEYTRKGRSKIWDDHTDDAKNDGDIELNWVERNNLCHRRNRILFGMDGEDPTQIDFGRFGFGTERTLEDYENFSGISFEHRAVQQMTLDNIIPPNNPYGIDKYEWANDDLVTSVDIRICMPISDLGEWRDDFNFCYVGAHDENGNEIHRQDISAEELRGYKDKGWIDYQYIFFAKKHAATYTVWVHSESEGWGRKITRPSGYGIGNV